MSSYNKMHNELLARLDWRGRAAFVPLLAAVIAPLSTLLDIPALTEPWFFERGNRLSDPKVNIALSAVGLFVNFLANVLLVLRFSVGNQWWKWATRSSLACWIMKLAIAISNVLAFGILTRNTPGITYGEGFWCAVVSIFINVAIVGMLLFHYVVIFRNRRKDEESDSTEVQVGIAGRHFMLQNALFVATIATLALFMSRLEDWSYLQGIYFSVVTFLTIGFGDFSPTSTVTQIVLFPFAIFGIIQVALLIEMIVTFVASRDRTRRARRKAQYEQVRQDEMDKENKEADLVKEMQFLREMHDNAYKLKIMQDLILNLSGFVLFWVLGALIFSQIEDWTYGQGMYFSYVFFLSIGYGDYSPVTPAGRVIFVLYSIIAVPVMTTFAVQTIQSILRRVSLTRLQHRREEFGLEAEIEEDEFEPQKIRSGAEDEAEKHDGATPTAAAVGKTNAGTTSDIHEVESQTMRRSEERSQGHGSDTTSESSVELPSEIRERFSKGIGKWKASHAECVSMGHRRIRKLLKMGQCAENIEKAEHFEDRVLTEYVLEQAVELERRARRILLASLKEGTNCHTLLKADRIVQLRDIKQLAEKGQRQQLEQEQERQRSQTSQSDNTVASSSTSAPLIRTRAGTRGKTEINGIMKKYYEEEARLSFSCALEENEMICEISKYREAFANLLAAGGRLMRLKDEEQFMFERRLRELEGETTTIMSP